MGVNYIIEPITSDTTQREGLVRFLSEFEKLLNDITAQSEKALSTAEKMSGEITGGNGLAEKMIMDRKTGEYFRKLDAYCVKITGLLSQIEKGDFSVKTNIHFSKPKR